MGIVAWELLTGERLFRAEGDAQILLEITEGNYRSSASVDSSIPAELDRLVMKALAVNANDRWPTAAVFAEALEGWARIHAELVSSAEVARLVHEFCGTAVIERRKTLTQVLQGVRPPAGFAAMRQTQGSGTGSTAGTSAPLTLDSVKVMRAVTPEEIADHRRQKRLVLVALAGSLGALALGLLIVFGAVVSKRGSEPEAKEPGRAAGLASAQTKPSVPSARVRVVVTADSDVTEIRGAGVGNVQFRDKGAELDLPRSDQPVTLSVRLSDGSEISETLIPNDNTAIRVRSVGMGVVKPGDLPVAPPTGKKPGVGRPAWGNKPGGLEANPYE